MSNSQYSLLAFYKNKKILISGPTGYIGSNLVSVLGKIHCQGILLVREGQELAPIPGAVADFSTLSGDIRARETWSKALEGIDCVFHLAAQTSAFKANKDPFVDFEINVLPVLHLLKICKEQGYPATIVFAGTATEVGITLQTPVDESFPDQPVTVYDIHKLIAEKYLQFYAWQNEVRTVTLRLSNVYGPGPANTRLDRGVLNQMILRALRGESLIVYGDGTIMRDYVFIEDVVSAFLEAGSKIDALNGNYYLIGSGVGTRLVDAINLVADRVARRIGRRPDVVHATPPGVQLSIEKRNFTANIERFNRATGWVPRYSLTEGIDHTIEYDLEQMGQLQEKQK